MNDTLSAKLGTDEIKDTEKRKAVEGYLDRTLTPDQQKSLLHVHKKTEQDLGKIREHVKFLNERNATAEEIRKEIIEKIQQDILERDLAVGYDDVAGNPVPSYIEQFASIVGTQNVSLEGYDESEYKNKKTGNEIDWDDQKTFNYCRDYAKSVIRTVPADVKREIRHQYVHEFLNAYADAINEFDTFGENFDWEERDKPVEHLKKNNPNILNFAKWLEARGQTLDGVTAKFSPIDTKTIVSSKAKLEMDRSGIEGLPKDQKDYYASKLDEIEALTVSNTALAQEKLAELEAEIDKMKGFLAFNGEIKKLKPTFDDYKKQYPDFDPQFETQIKDLQKQYDEQMKQINTEKNPQRRLVLMDPAHLKKMWDEINLKMLSKSTELQKKIDENKKKEDDVKKAQEDAKKAEEEKQKAAQQAEAGSQEPEDPPGILDMIVTSDPKLMQIAKDLAAKVPFIGSFLLSSYLHSSTLQQLGIKKTGLNDFFKKNGVQKTPEQTKELEGKAKKLLKDQFKIEKMSELDLLSKMSVKDFLKQKPVDFEQEKYDAFVAALKKNEAKDTTEQKVFEYILLNVEKWKS